MRIPIIIIAVVLILVQGEQSPSQQDASPTVQNPALQNTPPQTLVPAVSAPFAGLTFQQILDRAPVPKKTPYDQDERLKNHYQNSFRQGYLWASGMHVMCPTNPNGKNDFAIRGWVEGWKAGAKEGGAAGLPAKYAPFVAWNEPTT